VGLLPSLLWPDLVLITKFFDQAAGFVENLVVLSALDGNAQTGMGTAVELLQYHVERFEIAAAKLASSFAGDEDLLKDIGKFVQGCRCLCTGSYSWR
jgi:hypothetical protein